MFCTGECLQQKHTENAPSMRTECDYLFDWIKKKVTHATISPNMVIAGAAEEEEEKPRQSDTFVPTHTVTQTNCAFENQPQHTQSHGQTAFENQSDTPSHIDKLCP